ncbi:uncharacterized protein LOC121554579 isoform X2 [Coregonus clupeaformis]|uniref:uncharacterized protein LOC121554579 isoform X2 n=1 Tax=Coregonus clupeaformis TaxID=59861 RepID=UPI001BE0C506|nr:uncharacterized protein LOC121554579 isoform X2 [Coregonus clupeaformis]
MANCDYLQTQLTSVLNSLVKIAVVELLRIVEDSAVELRLEVSKSKFENEALKNENESNKNKLQRLEAELWTAGNRPCSICNRCVGIPGRGKGGYVSPKRDQDAAGPPNSSEEDDASSWLQQSAHTMEETTAMERDGIQIVVIKNEAGHEGTQRKKDTQAGISTEGEQLCPKVDMVYGKEWSQNLWRDGDAVKEDSAGPSVTHRQVKTVSAQKRWRVCVKKSVIEDEPADSSDAGIQHQNTTESRDVEKSFEPESYLNFEENRFLTSPVNIMVPKCVKLPGAAAVMDTQLDKSMDFDNMNNSGRKKRDEFVHTKDVKACAEKTGAGLQSLESAGQSQATAFKEGEGLKVVAMEKDGIKVLPIKKEINEGTEHDTPSPMTGEQLCPKVDMVYGKEWSQSLWRDGKEKGDNKDRTEEKETPGPSMTQHQIAASSNKKKRCDVCGPKKDRKTQYTCIKCKKYICNTHTVNLCPSCGV